MARTTPRKALLNQGLHVIGSARTPEKCKDLTEIGIESFPLNLETTDEIPKQLLSGEVLIITLPFKRSFKDPWTYVHQLNQLINHEHNQHAKRLIMCSSTSIYPLNNGIVTEESETGQTDRARALFEAEETVLSSKHQSPIILRFGGLFGPNREPSHFSKTSQLFRAKTPVNLVHLNDCVSVMTRMLSLQVPSGIYNVVGSEHPTKEAFYKENLKKKRYPLTNIYRATFN